MSSETDSSPPNNNNNNNAQNQSNKTQSEAPQAQAQAQSAPAPIMKQKRTQFSVEDKQLIITYKESNPKAKYGDICNYFFTNSGKKK